MISESFSKLSSFVRKIDYYKPSAENERMLLTHKDQPLIGANFPTIDKGMVHGGASDVGDLSQVTPISFLGTACHTTGTPGHSWANVASGGMSIGHKGLMHAAKALAITALDLYSDPKYLQAAKEEFERRMGGKKYVCPIPEDFKPPRLEPIS